MKKIIAMIICLVMAFSVGALAERGMGGPGDRMGGGMTQNDEEIQAVLDANASKFQQFSFTDEETGISFEYSLYVPEDYDASQSYPLIIFIPDSTGAGKSAAEIVEQYYGATVWVTDEEQAKHASFVLVPAFTGTVTTDNWEADPQIDAVVKLIGQLEGEYAIDADRLYTTGQSMPHMTANSGILTRQRLIWQASPVIVSYTLGWLALRSTWATMEGDGDEDNSRRLQSGVFLSD